MPGPLALLSVPDWSRVLAGSWCTRLLARVGSPVKLSRMPRAQDRPPPLLAQHTKAVLRVRLDLDGPTRARLAAAGIVGLPA